MIDEKEATRPLRMGATALVLAVLFTGCGDLNLLDVQDPDVVTPTDDPAAVPNKVAGMINTFREGYEQYVLDLGLLTDEYVLGGTFPSRKQVDFRKPSPSSFTPYPEVHEARRTADDNVVSFSENKDNPDFEPVRSDLLDGLALGYLYAGYSRLMLGEGFCQSIITEPTEFDEDSPLVPEDRIQDAISMFEQAIPAAQEAGLTGGATDVDDAARVGLARAYMFLGNYAEAANQVSQVRTDLQFNVDYSANETSEYNEVRGITWGEDTDVLRITVGNGEDPSREFEEWPYYDEWFGQNLIIPPGVHDRSAFGAPNRPVSLQTIYGDPTLSATGRDAPILLASGWEARITEAEVMLRNGQAQQAEDMVNALLTDPGSNPMTQIEPLILEPGATGEVFGEFEEVDFTDNGGFDQGDLENIARAYAAGLWQTGHRQHMLRRLYRNDGIDLYPTGPNTGDAMSMPLSRGELQNNDDVQSACPGGNTIPGKG